MKTRTLGFSVFLLLVVAPLARAENEHVLNAVGERSLILIGSQDRRYGFGATYQDIGPEARLKSRHVNGKLVREYYAVRTYNRHKPWIPGGSTMDLGFLASGRFQYHCSGRLSVFWEAGWGLHYSTRTTNDLQTLLNSTPTIGVGAIWGGKNPVYFTARLMHISNAGLSKPNKGQNQVWIMLGTRI